MNLTDLLAHSPPDVEPGAEWHRLTEHLAGTAELARIHMEPTGNGGWGRLAGLLHDLGKATPEWQAYLQKAHAAPNGSHAKVDHKLSGACFAQTLASGIPLALSIAGHHGGLHDYSDLKARIAEAQVGERLSAALTALPLSVSSGGPALPEWILAGKSKEAKKRMLETFTRILFSALVDADFLDTEAYYASSGKPDSESNQAARGNFPPLNSYQPFLDGYLECFKLETPVHQLRAEVLEACRNAGSSLRGAWTLTVPTGGGKTLSGLAWALRHAQTHGLRRVVVALPFTTIIEQTAKVFRDAFADLGPTVVLEHHSNLDPTKETPQNRVASENWDAPLIVTTQVQLFESLFSNKPSACRKLHRLQDSVIILDEVQSLPRHLLAPILDVLNDLVAHYGVSLLLMTATQPSLAVCDTPSGHFPGLAPAPQEIIPKALEARLWDGLRRVHAHWPGQWDAPMADAPDYWEALARRVLAHPSALAICHLKRDAQALFRAIQREDPEALHLSAAMCSVHRRAVLNTVRQRLQEGRPCHLVSTQVVEAGVDIDFPVVFRAMAGLESLAQSAGRCNREGRLEKFGDFFIFEPPTNPPGVLKEHRAVAQSLLANEPDLDLFSPATFLDYFRWLYNEPSRLDLLGIQPLRQELRFKTVAETFRLIPDATTPIFVPFDEQAKKLLEQLRFRGPSRDLLRSLQPYTVAVYERAFKELLGQGALDPIHEGFYALHQAPGPNYDPATGFQAEADASTLLWPDHSP